MEQFKKVMRNLDKAVKNSIEGATDIQLLKDSSVLFSRGKERFLLVPMYNNQAFLYLMRSLNYVVRGTRYNTEIPSAFTNIYEVNNDCTLSLADLQYIYREETISYNKVVDKEYC